MSFSSNAVADICGWPKINTKFNIDRFCSFSAEQVARRVCRYAGVTVEQLLETQGCRDKTCKLLCAVLKQQCCDGSQKDHVRQQQAYAALWTFLLPEDGRRPRGDRWLWQMQFCIGVSLTISTLAATPTRRCLRQAMRSLPTDTQKAIYARDLRHPAVQNLLQNNFDLLCGTLQPESILYLAVHAKSKIWYLGKTTCGRTRAKHVWQGACVRWREHFTDTFCRKGNQRALRYRTWQKFAPSLLSFIAIQCGKRQDIDWMETTAIRTLQPPTQCIPFGGSTSSRQRPTKPWARARRPVDAVRECELNVWNRNKPADWAKRAPLLWESWEECVYWARYNWQLSERRLVEKAFEPGHNALLVLLCGSGKTLLPWKRIWALPDPASTMCSTWCKAGLLGPSARRRAREKIERFLFSSSLLGMRPVILRIRSRSNYARHCANRLLGILQYHQAQMWGEQIAQFLRKKSRVLQQKPTGIHERTSDNIKLAKNFNRQQLEQIDEARAEEYRQFRDVRLQPYQCNVPGFNDDAHAIAQLWRGCADATQHLHNVFLEEDLWATAADLCNGVPNTYDHTRSIAEYVREQTNGLALAIVDRDPARRASMVEDGYRWRFHDHFASKPHLFEAQTNLSARDIATVRRGLAMEILPRRYWKHEWAESTNPFVYLTYKGKCFDDEGAWTCKSSHCHMREIVSYSSCPTTKYLSKIARCIRTIHRASVADNRLSFVLWHQGQVAEAMQKKIEFLRPHFRHPGVCPCGTTFNRLQCIKVDATAFFTLVNRARCIDEIRSTIDQLEKNGATGILIHKELKSANRVLYKGRLVPRTHQFLAWDAIRKALVYILFDKYFMAGDTGYERKDGLAMGSPTSPPITSFDLDYNSRRVYRSKQDAKQAGAYIPGCSTARNIQALLHVDDCFVCSKCFCEPCLFAIIQKLWPSDVEAKLEESGADIDFLHCHIHATDKSIYTNRVHITPLIPNLRFCEGRTLVPKVAKCQQYVEGIHRAAHLRPILWGKLAIISNTCRNNYNEAKQAILCACAEPILLGWPPRAVALCAANFPKSHRGQTANCIRLLGQSIKKSHAMANAWRISHTEPSTWIVYPWLELLSYIFQHVQQRMAP